MMVKMMAKEASKMMRSSQKALSLLHLMKPKGTPDPRNASLWAVFQIITLTRKSGPVNCRSQMQTHTRVSEV